MMMEIVVENGDMLQFYREIAPDDKDNAVKEDGESAHPQRGL